MPEANAFQPPATTARFQLRPLNTGEVLDRSLSLYRTSFWLCTGLTLIPAVITLLFGLARMAYMHVAHLSPLTPTYTNPVLVTLLAVGAVAGFAATGLASAGLQWAVGSIYLGRQVTLQGAIRIVRPHWFRYAALSVVQIVSSAWVSVLMYVALFAGIIAMGSKPTAASAIATGLFSMLALLSFPYSIYRYVRVSLAMPASVMEGLGIRDALRRSKALLPDRKGRIVLLFLLMGALYLVLGAGIGLLALLGVRGVFALVLTQIATLLTTFVATLLLQPYYHVAMCVFYYDERIRREGFDIEFMMQSTASSHEAAGVVQPQTPAYEL